MQDCEEGYHSVEEIGFSIPLPVQSYPKKSLTDKINVDNMVNMEIQNILKELVRAKGLRKTARELGIDPAALYRNLQRDLRVGTATRILDALGYDLRIVKKQKKGERGGRNEEGFDRSNLYPFGNRYIKRRVCMGIMDEV